MSEIWELANIDALLIASIVDLPNEVIQLIVEYTNNTINCNKCWLGDDCDIIGCQYCNLTIDDE
jgi:hypothetical protein